MTDTPATEQKVDIDLLLRKIDLQITQKGQTSKDTANQASYFMMVQKATFGEKLMFVFGHLFAFLMGGAIPVFQIFLQEQLDAMAKPSKEEQMEEIERITIIMICVACGVWVLGYLYWVLLATFAARITNRAKSQYLHAVLNQECAWFDQISYTELSSKIARETASIHKGYSEKAGNVTLALGTFLSGMAVGFYMGWLMACALLVLVPVVGLMGYAFGEVMSSAVKKSLIAYSQSAGYAEQCLMAIRVVVAFGMETVEAKNYERYLINAKNSSVKNHFKNSFLMGGLFVFIYFAYAYAFWVGGEFVVNQYYNHGKERAYTGGDALGVFFAIIIGLFSISMITNQIKAIVECKVAAKMLYNIIDRKVPIPLDDPTADRHNLEGEIEFKDVDFLYPSRPDAYVLQGFNAKFEKGKTTALVGPSGSGKSSIVQLTERFYDPEKGQILVDGKDIKSINLSYFRNQVGYVPQEPVLFNTSIKKNIIMGKTDATDAEVEEALKASNAWEFVQTQPDGVNTHVGAGGNQLSGGQKQRLALARAFIKKPKMFIFDEATSALDKNNEKEVQASIDKISRELSGVTSIVIAHRLSTVRNADKICVMGKGVVLEEGNHDELLMKYPDGAYAKLISNEQRLQQNADANKTDSPTKIQEAVQEVHNQENTALYDEMMTKANEIKDKKDQELAEKLKSITDPKKQEETFQKRLFEYNKPVYFILIGGLFQTMNGFAGPITGWFIIKCLFAMIKFSPEAEELNDELEAFGEDPAYYDVDELKSEMKFWLLALTFLAILTGLLNFVAKFNFGLVGENMTLNIRSGLYKSILTKHQAWHDNADNATGILSTVLAKDVQTLNGVSTEALAVAAEAMAAMLGGIIVAFIFTWKVALVACAVAPFMIVGGIVGAKMDAANSGNEEEESDLGKQMEKKQQEKQGQGEKQSPDLLANDAICNYRTIMGYCLQQGIVNEYSALNMPEYKGQLRSAHAAGLIYGYSKFIENACIGIILYFGTLIMVNDDNLDGEKVFIAIFAIIWGAFGAGQASAYGPDAAKGKAAAMKVFKITDTPSEIDSFNAAPESAVSIPEQFQGKIEFKNVWFRYPTRPKQWILRGLNLTINPMDNIALVAESGQGKSTIVLLLLRFYDTEFGEILVDGVNIKDYNLQEYRKTMGLVMQEPMLFNYTVKENILYGNQFASNDAIIQACEISNSRQFIESPELENAIDEDVTALYDAMQSESYKQGIIDKIGEEEYNKKSKTMKELKIKEDKEGKFHVDKDVLDERSLEQKGDTQLHNGYLIQAGTRGSKLSGGQKQRVAIARAVVRQPKILLLDEATSALDEDSQKKVQAALEQVMQKRTSIVIAHRMTTIERCNRIAVLEDGVIAEDGSFDQLSQKEGGTFKGLQRGLTKKGATRT